MKPELFWAYSLRSLMVPLLLPEAGTKYTLLESAEIETHTVLVGFNK